ncbi:MAG TPA: hypothetical protein VKB02_04180 [Pyrinomonadaceae bacterium]|nr:hypothetical protein [Pyrinomonadaceae bacterium]
MKRHFFAFALVLGLLTALVVLPRFADAQDDTPGISASAEVSDPVAVFQAAGPTTLSIQGSVDEFRAAVSVPAGRREINWDGGNPANQATVVAGNPFTGFQVTRGALFTTPDGTGFVQAPAATDVPPGGLAGLFNNPTYATSFRAFSASRLFSAIGGRITDVTFFVPGVGGTAATVNGFAAVFSDVDQPNGSGPAGKRGNRHASTLIEYYGTSGELLFSSFVPASPGDGGLSFFGIVFPDARIARVRITSGDVAPGPNDSEKEDVVMMDDFIYGEPRPIN